MGSSAAWQLAYAGNKVLLLEQQSEVYANGSSFGDARVTRSLGVKDDIFTYLKEVSVEETKKLVGYLGASMNEIHTTTPVTYLYNPSQIREVEQLEMDDDYTIAMNEAEAWEKFEMLVKDEIVIREYKEFSGTVNPRALIKALHQGIKKCGGSIRYDSEIRSIERLAAGYRITLRANTGEESFIESEKLVIAAGPHNGRMLKNLLAGFSELLTPTRMFLAFFKMNGEMFAALPEEAKAKFTSGFPVAKFDDQVFYAMIEKYDQDGSPIIKVGGHNRRFELKEIAWNERMPESEIAWCRDHLLSYLTKLGLAFAKEDWDCLDTYSCIYTLSNNEVPYVTNLLHQNRSIDPNVVVIAGLSGIGAKGSLAYGKFAADLLTGKDDPAYMYQKCKSAMGTERLLSDLKKANPDKVM